MLLKTEEKFEVDFLKLELNVEIQLEIRFTSLTTESIPILTVHE